MPRTPTYQVQKFVTNFKTKREAEEEKAKKEFFGEAEIFGFSAAQAEFLWRWLSQMAHKNHTHEKPFELKTYG